MPENIAVEIHHDFAALEARLAAFVDDLKARGGPLAPVAIVVPTGRLAAHLQRTLAERAGVLLAVRFFHHDALARAIADGAGIALPRVLGDGARAALVAHVVAAEGGELAEWMASRPRSAAALLSTFDDLREAGIAARAAAPGSGGGLSPEAGHTLRLYARYTDLLGRLESAGVSDRAGRVARALPHAAAFAARFDAIVHYGAYDLTGINLDLLVGLAGAGRPLLCLSPGHVSAPAYAYARDFWARHLGVEPVAVPPGGARGARLFGDRLPLLYDEEARTGPSGGSFSCGHAQGPAAEIGEAARDLLRGWRDTSGRAPRRPADLGIVARTLAPYALHLGPVLAAHGIPAESSAALPAMRQPAVQAAAWLLRCLMEDFPTSVLCDLLRTGLVRDADTGAPRNDEAPLPDAAERLLRDWQVAGGLVLVADRLPRWVDGERPAAGRDAGPEEIEAAARTAAARRRTAHGLARLVRRLARSGQALRAARTWAGWAAACDGILRRHIEGYTGDAPPPGAEQVLATLRDLGALDAAGLPLVPGAAAAAFAGALDAATVPIGSAAADGTPVEGDGGGVRVLDAMQARGLSFDTMVLVGMNADLFPRRPREDPFLPDDDRRLLRGAGRRPLALAAEARDEEHLLLAHLVGAARRRLVVLWQRADDEGQARAPSLALREIARLALGRPDLEALDAVATRASADPAARILAGVGDGLVAAPEAGLAAAFTFRSPTRLREALAAPGAATVVAGDAAAAEALSAGLLFLESIEGAGATPFDALVGPPGDEPATWSPSRLEVLGGCPQQYFFRHVLKVAEWEPPREAHETDAREMGALAHAVLRDLYAALAPRDGGAGGPPGARRAAAPADAGRVRALLREAWRRQSGAIAARMRDRFPGLWDLVEAQWLGALEEFVLRDAPAVLAALEPPRLEHAAEATIPLGGDRGDLRLRGRFDRLLLAGGGLVVGDYKTGGRPAALVEPAPILKGQRVQMPLYVLLAERALGGDRMPAVRAEALGVGPAFARAAPEERTAALEAARFEGLREGFLETAGVLVDLVRRGLYPLDPEPLRCGRCPYARACRRHHRPTLDRLRAHPDLARFHATRAKNTLAPTLERLARPPREPEA